MKTLVIDRSTANTSTAILGEEGKIEEVSLGIWREESEGRGLKFPEKIDRIVVGTGPGSFAGIRSALAFAQGYAIGSGCGVFGITSAASFASEGEKIAVVGDARRGKCWIALFDGFKLLKDVFQVEFAEVENHIPGFFRIATPDTARIGEALKEKFGEKYFDSGLVTAEKLARAFCANEELLIEEPLPIYLNPAVRD